MCSQVERKTVIHKTPSVVFAQRHIPGSPRKYPSHPKTESRPPEPIAAAVNGQASDPQMLRTTWECRIVDIDGPDRRVVSLRCVKRDSARIW